MRDFIVPCVRNIYSIHVCAHTKMKPLCVHAYDRSTHSFIFRLRLHTLYMSEALHGLTCMRETLYTTTTTRVSIYARSYVHKRNIYTSLNNTHIWMYDVCDIYGCMMYVTYHI